MAQHVSWLVPNRVLYIRQFGHVTLEDIHESTRQIADCLDAAYTQDAKLVIGILDLRNGHLDFIMRAVVSVVAQDIANVIDPRIWKARPGFLVLVTGGEAARLLISVVVRLFSQPMTTVGTLAEALTVVSYMYPELQGELHAGREADLSASTPS